MQDNKRLRAGVIGATGYVGQRFLTLLDDHPYFSCVALGASPRSANKSYENAVKGRWKIDRPMPDFCKNMMVQSLENLDAFCDGLDLVFCAVDMDKEQIRNMEEMIAKHEVVVISNNSAHRWTQDVPVIVPEINPEHAGLIDIQRQRLQTKRGFITAKPNCSIQSYVSALHPLAKWGIEKIMVSTYQSISGAGKTFSDWPEIIGNVIPYIGGEEEKSEKEPLKIWGSFDGEKIVLAQKPVISAQCYRVPVQEGHLAAVCVSFTHKPTIDDILMTWKAFKGEPQELFLPTAPASFIHYFDEPDRPQSLLDAGLENGMAVSTGRLREDPILDYKFVCLSHNTLRGAAGGGVLTAELLYRKGYLN